MTRLSRSLGRRLAPAGLTAAGVALLAAGLLAYDGPVAARPISSEPGASSSSVTAGASAAAALPTLFLPTFPPIDASAPPSVAPIDRVATRVVVESLGIDLPVIAQPDPSYPSCNVAMYLQDPRLGQPGSNKSIYLYAHARTGMFLPLLTEVRRNGGTSMIGMLVDVYTSDDQHYVYRISAVLPRVPADSHFLDKAVAVKREALWLQTSTGPGAKYPKMQVVARLVGVEPAPHAVAVPTPHPLDCS
jgi:hypothetical protein